jgi:hypothetical protein
MIVGAAFQQLFAGIGKVIHNVFVSLDYAGSMILWLNEEEPMTVSSRCGLALRQDLPGLSQAALRDLGRMLNLLDRAALKRGSTHCEESIAADIDRADRSKARLMTHPSTGE